eukprot:3153377-Pyramimonas_sp.AAC.1
MAFGSFGIQSWATCFRTRGANGIGLPSITEFQNYASTIWRRCHRHDCALRQHPDVVSASVHLHAATTDAGVARLQSSHHLQMSCGPT